MNESGTTGSHFFLQWNARSCLNSSFTLKSIPLENWRIFHCFWSELKWGNFHSFPFNRELRNQFWQLRLHNVYINSCTVPTAHGCAPIQTRDYESGDASTTHFLIKHCANWDQLQSAIFLIVYVTSRLSDHPLDIPISHLTCLPSVVMIVYQNKNWKGDLYERTYTATIRWERDKRGGGGTIRGRAAALSFQGYDSKS